MALERAAGEPAAPGADQHRVADLLHRALGELPDAAVLVVDGDGRFLFARGRLFEAHGASSADLEGRTGPEITSAERWASVEPALRAALAGERRSVRLTAADGEHSYRIEVAPVHDDDGAIVAAVGIAVDDTESRRTHDALVASEERFRLLAENSSDFVLRTTPDGVIEWISASVVDVLGWDPDELVGRRPVDFVHPDALARIQADTGRVNTGATVTGRIRVLCKDGSYRWMSHLLRPVYGDGGEVVARVSSWHDVEPEVAAEQALSASEEMFRLAMDTASVGMFVCSREARFVRVNPALCRMLGRDENDLYGVTFEDITHPDDIELSREALQGVMRGWSEKAHLRKRYLRPDGGVVWGDTSVAVVRDGSGAARHVLGQIVDVSVEVANFEAMQRAAADLRVLAENASDVVLRINEHGVITWVSPSVRTVLGWEPDVLVGTPSLSLIEHADHERVNANRAALREGGDGESMVIRYRTTWGHSREMQGRLKPLYGEDGVYRGGIIGLRDVTEEQAMRRELAHRATHDALTGLVNRDDLLDRLRARLGLEVRPRLPVGLLFLDVDHLKEVNDEHGHSVGDATLVEIARRIEASVRREDIVARLSGDEFVVMVHTIEGYEQLELVAEKCRAAVDGTVEHDGVVVRTSVSVGGVVAELGEDPDEVVQRADRAVYAAKSQGRNTVRIDRSPGQA